MAENNGIGKTKYSVTDGKVLPAFIMFLLPLIASSILMQSYSVADGLILGNYINQEALGAVSSCSSIIDACTLIQMGLAGGCSILTSHLYGGRRYTELNRLIRDMGKMILLISVIVLAAVFLLAHSILRLMHTPDSLMDGATLYLRIVFMGVPFLSLYNLQGGILRGMGDSKRPLGGIAVSSAVNIGLDLLFVAALDMGIAGAAIATVAAEIMSAAYLFVRLRSRLKSMDASGDADVDADANEKANLKECINLSIPQMIESAVFSAGNVLLQNITNLLGAGVVIGVSVAFKVDAILYIPLFSIGLAVGVFTGQNIGAGKPERVRQTMKYGICVSLGFSLLISLLLWKTGLLLFGLFGLNEEVAGIGFRYLMICLPFYWIFGLRFILNGYLNGSKHTAVTSGAAIAGLAGRLILAYTCYRTIGADVLPMAEVLSWIIGVVITAAAAIIKISRKK